MGIYNSEWVWKRVLTLRVRRVGFSWMSCKNYYSKDWCWTWVMVGLLICITHIGEEMLKTFLLIIQDPHLTLHLLLESHAVEAQLTLP